MDSEKRKPKAKKKRSRHRREPILSTGAAERMTAAQVMRLRQLARDGYEPEAFSAQLTKTEAAIRITLLEAKLRLQDSPPHTL
jgi:hypothetical protein